MGAIQDTIAVYKRLMGKRYKIEICDKERPDKNTTFSFEFFPEYYHHLAGFQHLTDLQAISNPKETKKRFYRKLERRDIKEETIQSSAMYNQISDRIDGFSNIEKMLTAEECKIVIDFDKSIAKSDIDAQYSFFKRYGNPFQGDATYYHLFIGYDSQSHMYYPTTYIAERSSMYVQGQIMLDCSIQIESIPQKAALVSV